MYSACKLNKQMTALGDGEGHGSLVCCSACSHKESDTAEGLTLSHADDTSLMAESEEKPLDVGEIGE